MIDWNDLLIAEMTGLIIAGGVMLTCCLVIWLCLDHLKRLGGRLLDKLHGWADERAIILPIVTTDAQMADELWAAGWSKKNGLWYAPGDGSCDDPMALRVAHIELRRRKAREFLEAKAKELACNNVKKF